MTDHDAILKAIIDAPADDLPRLAYADWCEENGDLDRADFIRVQIRLATMNSGCATVIKKGCDGSRAEWCLRCREFNRARAILNAHPAHPRWLGKPDPLIDSHPHRYLDTNQRTILVAHGLNVSPVEFLLARGFIESVRLPLAAWMEHGPRLVRQYPLTKVELSDKRPIQVTKVELSDKRPLREGAPVWAAHPFAWATLRAHATQHWELPAPLNDYLTGHHHDGFNEWWWHYATEQAALDDISAACLAWAKAVPQ